jgi:hypothetical protein
MMITIIMQILLVTFQTEDEETSDFELFGTNHSPNSINFIVKINIWRSLKRSEYSVLGFDLITFGWAAAVLGFMMCTITTLPFHDVLMGVHNAPMRAIYRRRSIQ